METTDYEVLHVDGGSSVVPNVSLRWGMLIMGEVMHVWVQWIHENPVPSTQFVCEAKTPLKNKILKCIHKK